jgi:uncharacterized protein
MNGLAPVSNSRPWVMAMRWDDLAFLHWPVPVAALEAQIPAGLQLETFNGHAWIGIVPFRMAGVRARGLPEIPGTNAFLELNVRTYVTDGTRPGVWFFSLDCANPLAVRGARVGFSLPYFDAQMQSLEKIQPVTNQPVTNQNSSFDYSSTRTHRGAPAATFRANYGPSGQVTPSTPGGIEHWLTERYCLYAQRPNAQVIRGEILHQPWPLQACTVKILENTLCGSLGLSLPREPMLAHFAKRLEVHAWLPTPI